ncbi:MAG: hypothetical protein AAF804_21965, partial [Bacteroidota bacterium]
LSGTYADVEPFPYDGAWASREFQFQDGKWSLVFTMGLDPKLENQAFRFRMFGRYEVQNPSSVVAGAFETLFWEDKILVTILTEDEAIVADFGLADCALGYQTETDISATGCAFWAPLTECNQDHDLVRMDKVGRLYFGERPDDNNMCTPDRRPTKLTLPVSKVKG